MELDNELADPPLCSLQIAGSKLPFEFIDFLLGLLEMGSRHVQFVLRRLTVRISDGNRDRHGSAYHGDEYKSEGE